jgi:mannose-6-phosphate isomerase
MLTALQLQPEYRPYMWGGRRLRPGPEITAEAWVVYEQDRITSGPHAGLTLAAAAEAEGEALLGRHVVRRTGRRFPLLIKLLDSQAWLSLQVHPNDEQAARLEGPGHVGKTEAWHILEAAPDAGLVCGLNPEVTGERMREAIRTGSIADLVRHWPVRAGDSLFLPAGTLHALGPGLLVYEVQQTSDWTYRVFDWGRPQTAGRMLHIEKALAVANVSSGGSPLPPPPLRDGETKPLIACEYFTLEVLGGTAQAVELNTGGESFHALTVIEGSALVEGDGWTCRVDCFGSVLVPAAQGSYRVMPVSPFRALKASVEATAAG